MSWKRLATFALGGALAAVGALVPAAQALLVPGVGLLGLATRWPEDSPPPRRDEDPTKRERKP